MLQFNPGFRKSASECLNHELFAKFRKDMNTDAQVKQPAIESVLYTDGQFNYEENEQIGLQYHDLKSLLQKEAQRFRRFNISFKTPKVEKLLQKSVLLSENKGVNSNIGSNVTTASSGRTINHFSSLPNTTAQSFKLKKRATFHSIRK